MYTQINKTIKITHSTKLPTLVKVNKLESPYRKEFFMQFDLFSFFISKEESNLPSRTNEVVRCEERLLASCGGENTFLPSFLVHSFDEVGNKGLPAVASSISRVTISHPQIKLLALCHSVRTQRLLVVINKEFAKTSGLLSLFKRKMGRATFFNQTWPSNGYCHF